MEDWKERLKQHIIAEVGDGDFAEEGEWLVKFIEQVEKEAYERGRQSMAIERMNKGLEDKIRSKCCGAEVRYAFSLTHTHECVRCGLFCELIGDKDIEGAENINEGNGGIIKRTKLQVLNELYLDSGNRFMPSNSFLIYLKELISKTEKE